MPSRSRHDKMPVSVKMSRQTGGVMALSSVALVTGGASGLGLATTRALVAAGYTTVALDLRGADEVAVAGGRFVEADVTDEASVQAAIDEARQLGPVRVLVGCAGVGTPGRVLDK